MENLHRFWHCSQTIYTGSDTSYSRSDPVDLLGYKQTEQVLTKVTHTKIQVFFQEISTGSYIAQWLFMQVLTQVTDFETEVLNCFLPDPVISSGENSLSRFYKNSPTKNACLFSGNLHRFWHSLQTTQVHTLFVQVLTLFVDLESGLLVLSLSVWNPNIYRCTQYKNTILCAGKCNKCNFQMLVICQKQPQQQQKYTNTP